MDFWYNVVSILNFKIVNKENQNEIYRYLIFYARINIFFLDLHIFCHSHTFLHLYIFYVGIFFVYYLYPIYISIFFVICILFNTSLENICIFLRICKQHSQAGVL